MAALAAAAVAAVVDEESLRLSAGLSAVDFSAEAAAAAAVEVEEEEVEEEEEVAATGLVDDVVGVMVCARRSTSS